MEHTLKIFNSESNMKAEIKTDKVAADNNVSAKKDEPVLYTIFSNYLAKNKRPAPKKEDKADKLAEMPVQMK